MDELKISDMGSFEDRDAGALKIIESALCVTSGSCAVIWPGPEGMVLLHLLKRAGGGQVRVPVLFVQIPGTHSRLLRFADKIRRIWRLNISVVILPDRRGGGAYTEDEVALAGLVAAAEAGYAEAILPWTSSADIAKGIKTCVPLSSFSDEDVDMYIEKFRLPRPSLSGYGARLSTPGYEQEDEAVRERLRELGYL